MLYVVLNRTIFVYIRNLRAGEGADREMARADAVAAAFVRVLEVQTTCCVLRSLLAPPLAAGAKYYCCCCACCSLRCRYASPRPCRRLIVT